MTYHKHFNGYHKIKRKVDYKFAMNEHVTTIEVRTLNIASKQQFLSIPSQESFLLPFPGK